MDVKELCAKNIKDEAEAIEGYYPLLAALEMEKDEEGVQLVKEIIADEKNHLNLLQGLMLEYDKINIAEDGMANTFDFLKRHLFKGTH